MFEANIEIRSGRSFNGIASYPIESISFNQKEIEIFENIPEKHRNYAIIAPRFLISEHEDYFLFDRVSFLFVTRDGAIIIDTKELDTSEYYSSYTKLKYYHVTHSSQLPEFHGDYHKEGTSIPEIKLYFTTDDLRAVYDLFRRWCILANTVTDYDKVKITIKEFDLGKRVKINFMKGSLPNDQEKKFKVYVEPDGKCYMNLDYRMFLYGSIVPE